MIKLLKVRRWTSDLEIYVKEDTLNLNYIFSEIDGILTEIENKYSSFKIHGKFDSMIQSIWNRNHKLEEVKDFIEKDYNFSYCLECNKIKLGDLINFITYDIKNNKIDFTGIMKGYAIHRIYQIMSQYSESFLINFGGDILGYHVSEKIEIDIHKELKMSSKYIGSGDFVFFSSGNYDKNRGNHIIGAEKYIKASNVISKDLMPIRADYFATLSITDATLEDEYIHISRYDERGNFL